jgi:hypothetical protein
MERTWKPTTAGVLTIIAGAMSIGRGALLLALAGLLGRLSAYTTEISDLIRQWAGVIIPGTIDIPAIITEIIGISSTVLIVIGAISLTFGIISLVGGIQAVRRRAWGLALAGSILAIASSALLGILSIIFVSMGKKEFARP